jgi:transporter family protein
VQSWQLWAAAAALFAAITALLTKLGVQSIDAGMATLLRTVVVSIALALVLVSRGQLAWSGLLQLPGSGVLALALSGLATGLSWFCYNRALQLGPVAAVAALDKLSVVLVALLAWLVLGEPLGLKAWIGIVARVQADPALRQQVSEAITADAVAMLAQELGYPVSGSDLLRFSGRTAAGVRVTRIDHPGEYPGRYV